MTKKTLYQVQELKAGSWHVLYTYLVGANAYKIVNIFNEKFPTREFRVVEVKPQEEI